MFDRQILRMSGNEDFLRKYYRLGLVLKLNQTLMKLQTTRKLHIHTHFSPKILIKTKSITEIHFPDNLTQLPRMLVETNIFQ